MKDKLPKTQGFEQLIAWQKARELAVTVYKLMESFPTEEKFALTNQIRRAASSVPANIAEGYGRRGLKEKVQFYTVGYGSLLELKSHLHLSVDLGYLSSADMGAVAEKITDVQKLVNALISSINQNGRQ